MSLLTTISVRFKEYSAVEYRNADGWGVLNSSNRFFGYKGDAAIRSGNIFSRDTFEIQKDIYEGDSKYLPKKIENKWIYVFRTTNYTNEDGTNILLNKIHLTDPDKTYQLPIFENYKGNRRTVFSFFCLSQIELCDGRIKQLRELLDRYLKNWDSSVSHCVCPRLTFIPLDSEQIEFISGSRYSRLYNGQQPTENVALMGVGDNRVTTVYLTDYLGVAQGMAKNYQDNKILFQEEMEKKEKQRINKVEFSDISFAEYSTIAELTLSLCHVDGFERRHKKHVDYEGLQEWRQTLLDRMKPMIDLYSQSAAMFLPWLRQDAFHAMLFDYSFNGEEASDTIENALGNMFELLYEEIQGRDFFKAIFEDSLSQLDIIKNEGNNLNIEDISRRFNEKNWFTVCFYVARKGPVGFSKILSAFSTIISMKERSTAIENFTHIIDHRFTNNLVSITNAKLAAYHNRYVNITVWKEAMSKRYPGCTFYTAQENGKLVQYVGYESVEINQGRIAVFIKGGQDGMNHFLTALSIFNLGVSLYSITQTTNSRDAIIKTLVAGGALANLVMKFIGTSSKVTLSKVGIITALIDTVNSENSRSKALSMNDDDLATAQGIVTAGNIIAATGCAITLVAYMKAGAIGGGAIGSAAGGIGAVPGAAVGSLIGLIGGLIVIGGSVMATYVADSEYEAWLEHSLWGDSFCKSGDQPQWAVAPFDQWNEKLSYQTESFHNIQYDFTLDLRYANDIYASNAQKMLRLTIEPKALQVVSRMYVSFWVSNGTDPVLKLEDQKEIIEQQYGTVLMENTANQKILLRWCESRSPRNIRPFLEQEITELQEEYAWTMSTTDSRTIIDKIKNDLLITNGLNDNIKVLSFNKAGNIQDSLIFYIHAKLDLYGNGSVIINKTIRPSVRVTLSEQDIVRLGNRLRFN